MPSTLELQGEPEKKKRSLKPKICNGGLANKLQFSRRRTQKSLFGVPCDCYIALMSSISCALGQLKPVRKIRAPRKQPNEVGRNMPPGTYASSVFFIELLSNLTDFRPIVITYALDAYVFWGQYSVGPLLSAGA